MRGAESSASNFTSLQNLAFPAAEGAGSGPGEITREVKEWGVTARSTVLPGSGSGSARRVPGATVVAKQLAELQREEALASAGDATRRAEAWAVEHVAGEEERERRESGLSAEVCSAHARIHVLTHAYARDPQQSATFNICA